MLVVALPLLGMGTQPQSSFEFVPVPAERGGSMPMAPVLLLVAFGLALGAVVLYRFGLRVSRRLEERKRRQLIELQHYVDGYNPDFTLPDRGASQQSEMLEELKERMHYLRTAGPSPFNGYSLEHIWDDICRRWTPGFAGIGERLKDEKSWYFKFGSDTPPWKHSPQPPGSQPRREPIPPAVKREVWRRDQGRCVQCSSQEQLEFDHIIPISKGGANTARNLQLLCEWCNRSKGASIQ